MTRRRWLLLLVLYALTFQGVYFGGNMQRAVLDPAVALVEWGRLDIGELWTNTPDSAHFEQRYYSGMPPGVSFLAVPVYAVAKLAWHVAPGSWHRGIEAIAAKRLAEKRAIRGGTGHSVFATPFYKEQLLAHVLLNLLLGVGGGAVLFGAIARLAVRLGDQDGGQLAAVAAMFGTALAFYAGAWYTQSVALAFLLLALECLFAERRRASTALLGGVLAGAAGVVDYPFFVLAGVALVFAALLPFGHARSRLPSTLAAGAGFALPLATIMLYHAACFGSPFSTPYNHRTKNREQVPGIQRMGLGAKSFGRAVDLTVGAKEGLLWHAPTAFLGFFGIVALARRRQKLGDDNRLPLQATMIVIVVLSTVHWLSVPWNSWEAAYGPRYYLAALTLLMLLAPREGRLRRAFVATALAGAVVNHLNLIGLRPIEAVAARFAGATVDAPQIVLFPFSLQLGVGPGLAVDLAYQVGLVVLALMLRSPRATPLGSRVAERCEP